MLRSFLAALLALAPAALQAAEPAPVESLIRQVSIPWQRFVLPNGLTVLVHTDRKAPIVAVSVWYHVGSKDEPASETGFAHLFEHLMFGGSESAPEGMDNVLLGAGATNPNGSTSFDRTNYFETVPTAALPLTLFLESDRMGHLLGAVTQAKLDAQRGVVQNEKRQGDNQPYGLTDYAQLAALFPAGHPYRHSTIGSMRDLDQASLATVKNWFRARYGPNNAVLVLAGDIDVAAARPLVERYFAEIPRGPAVTPATAEVPTLPRRIDETLKDRVATTRLSRSWVVPGLTADDFVPLEIGAAVLGGLSSSRLDNALVRREKTAVAVSADVDPYERVGLFTVLVDVNPGGDAVAVGRRLDALIAQLVADGPTADEVKRVATQTVAARLAGLEQVGGVGGKAVTLAEGQLYAGDPDLYREQLARYAAATPAQVHAALKKWLGRPVYALAVVPGERGAYDEAKARTPERAEPDAPPTPATPPRPEKPARAAPPVGATRDLVFPAVERTQLSNGIAVAYARRAAVPLTRVSVAFDAGIAADPPARRGTGGLMLSLLDEATTSRDSIQIAEEEERLGASIAPQASMDRTSVELSALSANLRPSLDLLADVIRNPAFTPLEVDRLRQARLAAIQAELTAPSAVASRVAPRYLFGPAHPYAAPFSGSGDPAVVATLTPAELRAFHQAWIRPDNACIFVVSDRPLAEVRDALEKSFGDWRPPTAAKGIKRFDAAPPQPGGRIVLIDRPGSPQSFILGAAPLAARGTDRLENLLAANEVLGASFLSRLNLDLREGRGWAYGVRSQVSRMREAAPFLVLAPVQADRTGDSIRAMIDDMTAFLGPKGVTHDELRRTTEGSILELPGQYETGDAVLAAMRANELYARPDDYQSRLPALYRAQTAAGLDAAARTLIDPKRLSWIVVGDAAKVRPQLARLGLPLEIANPK